MTRHELILALTGGLDRAIDGGPKHLNFYEGRISAFQQALELVEELDDEATIIRRFADRVDNALRPKYEAYKAAGNQDDDPYAFGKSDAYWDARQLVKAIVQDETKDD